MPILHSYINFRNLCRRDDEIALKQKRIMIRNNLYHYITKNQTKALLVKCSQIKSLSNFACNIKIVVNFLFIIKNMI